MTTTKSTKNKTFNKAKYVNATKAVVLARVSSKDQEKNYSNEAQKNSTEKYCDDNGLEVLKFSKMTESSTRGERKLFNEMLGFALKEYNKQGEPVAIVCDTIDRLQRSYKESVKFAEYIEKGMIELHFLRESLQIRCTSNSSDIIRWDMGVLFAKAYIEQLKDNVYRGQQEQLSQGCYPRKAPIGYVNVTGSKNSRSRIEVDKLIGPVISDMFKMYSTGKYGYKDLLKFGVQQGIFTAESQKSGIAVSKIETILKNKFYYGVMTWNGEEIPHIYPPLTDKETYEKCKKIREQKDVKRGGQKIRKKVYKYSGIVTCAETGYLLSPSPQKGGKFVYYRTPHSDSPCKGIFVPERQLDEIADQLIDKVQVPDKDLQNILDRLKNTHKENVDAHEKKVNNINLQIKTQKTMLDNAVTMLLQGPNYATKNILETRVAECEAKIVELTDKLKELTYETNDYYLLISRFLHVVNNFSELYKTGDSSLQNEILKIIVSNWVYDGQKFSIHLHKPFATIVENSTIPIWQKVFSELTTQDFNEGERKYHQLYNELKAKKSPNLHVLAEGF